MKPGASPITVSYSGGSASLYADEVIYSFVTEPFDRLEFSNDKLKAAPTTSGALPTVVYSFANTPLQLAASCAGDVPRPLNPDDDNINSIKWRFDIQRYTIKGAASAAAEVDKLYTQAATHIKFLAKFQAHLVSAQLNVSYTKLVALQGDSFTYLTTTGVSLAGDSIGGTATNMLITECVPDVAYEVTTSGGGKLLLKKFSLTIENRIINALAA